MRPLKILIILAICSSMVFLMGLRPKKYEEPNEIDTLLGTVAIPDGYEAKTMSGGKVRLDGPDGVAIVIDELAADKVAEGGYTADSVKPILAKIFEPKVVKEPETLEGALLFRGYGAADGASVAFFCNLIDTPNGAGMILVFGPNSQRESLQSVAETVVVALL